MKRILLVSIPLALFAACGGGDKTGCKQTGCSAGSVCNANTGACEVLATGGGGGSNGGGTGGGGGGTTGGGSGGGAGGTGGGGGTMDAGFDAGVIDPFDDGGVFVPGDICSYPIPVEFDGGLVAVTPIDLGMETDQYNAACNSSTATAPDAIFQITTTEAKGLIVTATDTSGKSQDAVIALINSPCASFNQAACTDTNDPVETLTIDRLPAGTWYVLLENYSSPAENGTYDVQFELTDPAPGPANDTCSAAQAITFMNGTATVSGTTTGSFNDTAGQPLTCSARSALSGEVFYTFTLTQPQDVTVTTTVPMGSMLDPAVAITTVCGQGGAAVQKACSTSSSFIARNLAAGTYFLVVDGNSAARGDFSLALSLGPATLPPANDTCAAPTTLVPGMPQTIDVNTANTDYRYSCSSFAEGGDVVYQFTTTMPQKVTVTATGMNGADPVLSVRNAPCDDDTNEIDCSDSASGPEEVRVQTLPAGTYYVLVSAYGQTAGQITTELTIEPPPVPPANDQCATAATLVPNMSQMVDVTVALSDYSFDCDFPSTGEAVFTFTTTAAQRVRVTATGTGDSDAVLALRGPPCDTATDLQCASNAFGTDPEVVSVNNLPAGTYYVLLASNGSEGQFGIELELLPVLPPPTNETCTNPEQLNITTAPVLRSVDLTSATVDIPSDVCATTSNGPEVVYEVTIPTGQALTVVATPSGALDVVLFSRTPTCATTPSEDCIDDFFGTETLEVPNTTGAPKTVFIVVKAYDAQDLDIVDLTFTLN